MHWGFKRQAWMLLKTFLSIRCLYLELKVCLKIDLNPSFALGVKRQAWMLLKSFLSKICLYLELKVCLKIDLNPSFALVVKRQAWYGHFYPKKCLYMGLRVGQGETWLLNIPPPCIEMLFLVLFMIQVPSLPARGNFEEMLVWKEKILALALSNLAIIDT